VQFLPVNKQEKKEKHPQNEIWLGFTWPGSTSPRPAFRLVCAIGDPKKMEKLQAACIRLIMEGRRGFDLAFRVGKEKDATPVNYLEEVPKEVTYKSMISI
jgi:hypothetical protein